MIQLSLAVVERVYLLRFYFFVKPKLQFLFNAVKFQFQFNAL